MKATFYHGFVPLVLSKEIGALELVVFGDVGTALWYAADPSVFADPPKCCGSTDLCFAFGVVIPAPDAFSDVHVLIR